jgi:prepilin-type N-terminal cleavage/methylation domain-containing protein
MIQQQKKGFTLIELLVVIAIIGILSAIGLVSLGGAREKARDAQRKTDVASMRTALQLYYDDHSNKYPGTAAAAGTAENVSAANGFNSKIVGTNLYITNAPAISGASSSCDKANNYWYVADAQQPADSNNSTIFAQLEGVGCQAVFASFSGTNGQWTQQISETAGNKNVPTAAKCGSSPDVCAANPPTTI